MGIHLNTSWKSQKDGSLLRIVSQPGIEEITVFAPVAEIEIRTNCYCCSCGEREGFDPYCRNHGWAGTRKCEVHDVGPGDTQDEEGRPLGSVQQERARQRALENEEYR
jgi:hypothetical protein